MRRFFVLTVVLSFCFLTGQAAGGDALWTGAGLSGQFIESLLFLPDGTLLAGSTSGGVQSSPDSGATWSSVSSGLPGGVVVFDLMVDADSSRVLAATGAGVYQRQLAGGDWSLFGPGALDALQVNSLAILGTPFAGDEVLAGTVGGVYRSSLATPGWSSSAIGMTPSTVVNDLTQVDTVVVAATGDGAYVSLDGGATWELRTSGQTVLGTYVIAADTTKSPPRLLAGTFDGVFVSQNWAMHWDELTVDAGLTSRLETRDLLVDPGYEGSVYAAVFNIGAGGVYQSSDGGEAWRGVGGGLTSLSLFAKTLTKPAPDSRLLFIGTGNGVWVTLLPTATGIDPSVVFPGSSVTITGSLFGDTQDGSVVFLSPGIEGVVGPGDWSDGTVVFEVPVEVETGRAAVARAGGMSNGLEIIVPRLDLEDLDSRSRSYSDSVEVRALHPVVGVDSLRLLASPDVVSWSLGALGEFQTAGEETSRVVFAAPPTGTGTVQAVMEYMAGALPAFRDTAEIVIDLVAPEEPPLFALRDLTSGDSVWTDSSRVWFVHGGADAAFMSLETSPDVVSWHLWPSGQSVPGPFGTWVDYHDSTQLVLAAGDGPKQVGLALRDSAGNVSSFSTGILLDTEGPVASLVELSDLDSGFSEYTDSSVVRVHHEATGADFVRIRTDSADWWSLGALGSWIPYADSSMVRFLPGDAIRDLWVAFTDSAGNETPEFRRTITVDTTGVGPPDSLYLADLDSWSKTLTDSALVVLRHRWTQSDSFRVVPTPDVVIWSPWDTIEPGGWIADWRDTTHVTLYPGSGERTVMFEGKDRAGNTRLDSVSITMDTEDPATEPVEARDISSGVVGHTDSLWVVLFHRSEDADSLRLTASPGVAAWSGGAPGVWVPYDSIGDSSFVELTEPDGPKPLRVEFSDQAGNVVADTADMDLDRVAPGPLVVTMRDSSSGRPDLTDSPWVLLVHTAGGADSMRLLGPSDDSLWTRGPVDTWVGFADSSYLRLTQGDGVKRVYIQFRDLAGNTSGKSDSIRLDTLDPAFFVSLHQNPILTAQLIIYTAPSESLTSVPTMTVDETALALSAVPDMEPFWLYQAHYQILSAGLLELVVRGEDPAGNVGERYLSFGVASGGPTRSVALEVPGEDAVLVLGEGAIARETYLLGLPHEWSAGSSGDDVGDGAPRFSDPWTGVEQTAVWGEPAVSEVKFLPAGLELLEEGELRFHVPGGSAAHLDSWDLAVERLAADGWKSLPTWLTEIDGEDWIVARVGRLGTFRLGQGTGEPLVFVPREFRLMPNRPNPFNPETSIIFDLPLDGRVSLEVYDVKGRRVAKPVASKLMPAGRHQVVFRGLDDQGRQLGSGVYFYRLTWRDRASTQKMLLLK